MTTPTTDPTALARHMGSWAPVLAETLDAVFDDTSPAFALEALHAYRAAEWEAENPS